MENKGTFFGRRAKKKTIDSYSEQTESMSFIFNNPYEKARYFTYSSAMILFCIQLFLNASVSFRACSKICAILSSYIKIRVPHFTTIRMWVLRLGYYCLDKPKEIRDDWVYIIDYTITTSKNKCLMILGISLAQLKEKQNFSPKLSDVEPLYISVIPKANWQATYNALNTVCKLTGIPDEIISDHGADIKKGTEEFCKDYPSVRYIYDITHLIACKIKTMLSGTPTWEKFVKKIKCCKQQTKQSVVSFLSPPSQRSKARFLNIAPIISWGKKILKYKQKGDFIGISKALAEKNENKHNTCTVNNYVSQSIELFDEKFGWLIDFKREINEYSQYVEVIKTIKKEITTKGVSSQTIKNIECELRKLQLAGRTIELQEKIIEGMKKYVSPDIKGGKKYLGCSDVIESLFGKYKNHCSENSMRGMTQSVLIMAAITSKLDNNEIKTAMEYCIYMKIQKWSKFTIGESDFSKRKIAFSET